MTSATPEQVDWLHTVYRNCLPGQRVGSQNGATKSDGGVSLRFGGRELLNVLIVSGIGAGETTLSAFDAALAEAGIHNFNLIKVSSILPRGWGVEPLDRYEAHPDEYGQRLYVVMAEVRTDRVGTTIGAGLGWYQAEDGRGLFAEHVDQVEGQGSADAEHNVASKIDKTMRDLCAIRDWPFCDDRLRRVAVSSPVADKPTCVLVAGVYSAEPF